MRVNGTSSNMCASYNALSTSRPIVYYLQLACLILTGQSSTVVQKETQSRNQ